MRKKFVFLAAVLLCLGGCQSEEKQPPQAEEAVPLTQETEEDLLEYDTELPEQLSDFQFAIDEEVYTLPDSIEAWKKQGWELEGENKEELLEADSFVEGKRLIRGEDSLDDSPAGAFWSIRHSLSSASSSCPDLFRNLLLFPVSHSESDGRMLQSKIKV